MKLPVIPRLPRIPLPEPEFMITLTRGSTRGRRAGVHALRFLLWLLPAGTVDYALATAGGGRHALWLTLVASYATLVLAVLLVNVRDGGGEEAS